MASSPLADTGSSGPGPGPDANAGFRHLGDDEVAQLHRVSIVRGRYEAPDGTRFERDIVRDIGWVGVVPLLDDGETVVVVRQYRPAIDAFMIEIPAGLRDVPGEAPTTTAHRELAEEAGKAAGRLDQLAHVHNSAGLTDEDGFIYLARDLTDVPTDAQGPEEDHMEITTVRLADVGTMIASGALTDVKTIIGLLLTRDALHEDALAGR